MPLLAAASLAFLSAPSLAAGFSVTNLHSFGVFSNGEAPYGSLVQGTNGLFYGTTYMGGVAGYGVVFEVSATGAITTLYSFTNGVDGGGPEAGLALGNDGNFYGATSDGGSNNTGVVFRITQAGVFTPLYSFHSVNEYTGVNSDGAIPFASLVPATDGNLYGTTSQGGANGSGTIFKISVGGAFSLVYAFTALDVNGYNNEGASPQAALVQGADGSLCGTASSGGSNGCGAVFKYILTSSAMSPLYSFTGGNDGANPYAALVQGTNGIFYGTTAYGGANSVGALFQITSGGAFTPLYSFTGGTDGGNPVSPLAQGADGYFYGATTIGGTSFGAVFKMSAGGAVTPLYSFTGGTDGATPQAALFQASPGIFYGTASSGGSNGAGAVFKINSLGALSKVMSFVGGYDGENPLAPLVQHTNGNFYGTTYYGGASNYGVVFQLTPAGAQTPIYSFTNGTDGGYPVAGLALGTDGNLYGATYSGGANHLGVLFKITTNGALTALHSLVNASEGGHPQAALTLGTDGNFYGTAYSGGSASGNGSVFQMTPAGAVTLLHAFTNGVDGSYPYASLTQGSDGNFYGTTTLGGTNHHGAVFKITSAGALTPLYSFTNGVDGATPQCQLAQGPDGNFYGTATNGGGTYNSGVVFKITSAGAFTRLYAFTNGVDGAMPAAGLALGHDGNFYGTTRGGGSNFYGSLFKITSAGAFTPLYSFVGDPDGKFPVAALVLGADANFYGAASSGGVSGYGSAFRLAFPALVAPHFTSISQAAGSVSFSWSTVSGQWYQLQAATDLTQTNWSALGNAFAGTNGAAGYSDSPLTNARRFYRVDTWQP
jgi:uncharacterized repeat protein (TIGR03803 family)